MNYNRLNWMWLGVCWLAQACGGTNDSSSPGMTDPAEEQSSSKAELDAKSGDTDNTTGADTQQDTSDPQSNAGMNVPAGNTSNNSSDMASSSDAQQPGSGTDADSTAAANDSTSDTSSNTAPDSMTGTTGTSDAGNDSADPVANSDSGTSVTEPDPPAPDAANPDPADSIPSWTNDIVPLFQTSCGSGLSGCHSREVFAGQANSNCRGWLSLEDAPLGATYWGEYKNGESTGCPDVPLYDRLLSESWQCDGIAYVVPGDPDAGYLFRKIAGGPLCDNGDVPSDPMPLEGELEPEKIDMIRRWIAAGAPYDGN